MTRDNRMHELTAKTENHGLQSVLSSSGIF